MKRTILALCILGVLFTLPVDAQEKVSIVVSDSCGYVIHGKNVPVSVSAVSSSGLTITSVQVAIDGNNVGAPMTTAPYNMNWDSTTVPNGCHSMSAAALDSDGDSGIASIPVSVKN